MGESPRSGENAACHALLGTASEMLRCGRPEDHRYHVPGNDMAHVYSPDPPDPDDTFGYEWGPLCEDCGGTGRRPGKPPFGMTDSWYNHDGTYHCGRCHASGHVVGPLYDPAQFASTSTPKSGAS